jgi:hypothetical protein
MPAESGTAGHTDKIGGSGPLARVLCPTAADRIQDDRGTDNSDAGQPRYLTHASIYLFGRIEALCLTGEKLSVHDATGYSDETNRYPPFGVVTSGEETNCPRTDVRSTSSLIRTWFALSVSPPESVPMTQGTESISSYCLLTRSAHSSGVRRTYGRGC